MTYHVGPNGKPSICKAKKGNCPYESISPHFDTVEKAQLYSDNLNAFIAKNITTETELTKHCKIYEIADTQDMIIRLDKAKRIEKELLKQADAQYLKLEKIMKRNRRKCPTKEEFLSNFKENDSLYKAEQEKTQKYNKILIILLSTENKQQNFSIIIKRTFLTNHFQELLLVLISYSINHL